MKTLCPTGLTNAGRLVCSSVATVAAGLPCFTSFLLREEAPARLGSSSLKGFGSIGGLL